MSDLLKQMKDIRAETSVEQSPKHNMPPSDSSHQKEATATLRRMFRAIATEIAAGDYTLSVRLEQKDPGFTIKASPIRSSILPPFSVSATYQTNLVKIQIKDGHWEQIRGYLGAWGNWTDQKTVYTGAVDEDRMTTSVEEAFFAWYRRNASKIHLPQRAFKSESEV